MVRKCKNGIFYYQFRFFQPFGGWLKHGFFPRQDKSGKSLNVSYSKGTARQANDNRERIARVFGLTHGDIVSAEQMHKANVRMVRQRKKIQRLPDEIKNTDALMTDRSEILLLIKVADCQPVYLVAPRKRKVALAHAGWRGLTQNIIGETVKKMAQEFKVKPSEIYAGVGPSLCLKCSEFKNRNREFPAEFRGYFRLRNRVDLKNIARDQLIQAGLKSENIETTRMCPACQIDRFFSYRGEKGLNGLNAAVICAKNY